MTAPRFTHDCDACVFLGTTSYVDPFSKRWIDADLYHCPADTLSMGGSCIARVSDEPSEYSSAPLRIARDFKPPFSTLGRAVYIAALAVLSKPSELKG